MRKFKNCSNIIFTHLVERKTAADAYENTEILVKIFRQTQMVVFFGTRKSNGIELYQP